MTAGFLSNKKNTIYRARSAVLSRDFELAARLFKRMLKENPDNVELMHELATTYIRSGEDTKALEICEQILKNDSNDYNALLNLGGIYRRLGRYDESVSVLERARFLNEDDIQAFYTLGFTLKQMGNFDEALHCFNHVIEHNPSDILAYNHLGSIYSLRGDSKNAIASYQRGLQLDANHPILHYNLALEYEKIGHYDEVQKEYEAALRAKPGWSEAINGYASFLMSLNRNKEAHEILSQGIEVAPKNIHLQRAMGVVQLRRGEYSDSVQRFKAVLEQDEDDIHALMGLADVYGCEGRAAEAERLLQKVDAVPRKNREAQLQYARSLLNANKFEKAGELINDLLNEYSFDLATVHLVAEYYACCNDLELLNKALDKINEIDGSYYLHYLDIAQRFRQIGKFETAQNYLIEYLKHMPNDSVALTALAFCYERCKQFGDALVFYQQALHRDHHNSSLQNTVERLSRYSELSRQDVKKENVCVAPAMVIPPLRDLYDDKSHEFPVPTEQPLVIEVDAAIDEEHYREPETTQIVMELDYSTRQKPRTMEHYDPLVVHAAEPENKRNGTSAGLEALTNDDGPVDYNPLMSYNQPLNFQDEEGLIFNNSEQNDFERYLKEDIPKAIPEENWREPAFQRPEEPPYREIPPVPQESKPRPEDVALPWDFDGDASDLENAKRFEPIDEEDVEMVTPLEEPIEELKPIEEDIEFEGNQLLSAEEYDSYLNADINKNNVNRGLRMVEEILPQKEASIEISQEINRLMEKKASPVKNDELLALFQEMKRLCDYLPNVKRDGFNAGLKRIQMDYVISRLSGKPGLLALAEAIREKGLVQIPDEKYDIVERFDEPAVSARVIGLMRPLVQQLPNKNDALSLDGSLRNLLERLAVL